MLDARASLPHYAAHLRPLWVVFEPRGTFYEGTRRGKVNEAVLVASHADMLIAVKSGYRHIALMEHGIGQSYGYPHPSYAGGANRGPAGLYLAPNETAAQRERAAYPGKRVEVIGSPRLATLPGRDGGGGPSPVVAVSFHWSCAVAPETRCTYPYWKGAIADLAERYTVLGHAHPRANLRHHYRRAGIEYVESFDEVCRRADVFIADNTSALYEFASTGRPVVLLNHPTYRRDVEFGLRFWEAAHVGVQADHPKHLLGAVEEALDDAPWRRRDREHALTLAYGPRRHEAPQRALAVVSDWLTTDVAVAA